MKHLIAKGFLITYLIICLYDFIVGPFIFNYLQFLKDGQSVSNWQNITLEDGAVIHFTFLALIALHKKQS